MCFSLATTDGAVPTTTRQAGVTSLSMIHIGRMLSLRATTGGILGIGFCLTWLQPSGSGPLLVAALSTVVQALLKLRHMCQNK